MALFLLFVVAEGTKGWWVQESTVGRQQHISHLWGFALSAHQFFLLVSWVLPGLLLMVTEQASLLAQKSRLPFSKLAVFRCPAGRSAENSLNTSPVLFCLPAFMHVHRLQWGINLNVTVLHLNEIPSVVEIFASEGSRIGVWLWIVWIVIWILQHLALAVFCFLILGIVFVFFFFAFYQ